MRIRRRISASFVVKMLLIYPHKFTPREESVGYYRGPAEGWHRS